MPRHFTPPMHVCPACGELFRRHLSQFKGPRAFCSKACAYANKKLIPLADRFWARVEKTESCWLWTGCLKGGRPKISIPTLGRRRKMLLACRLSWELAHGPIPDGLEVCHNCPGGDNPRCVNPEHLFLGTHADNMRDAGLKGQMARGESNHAAKLTEVIVRSIRTRYAAGGVTQQQLADEFGVTNSVVCHVISRKAWRHV